MEAIFPVVRSFVAVFKVVSSRPCVERLIERHGHTGSSPADLRLLFIVVVGYSGFLRISELLSIKPNHIKIMPEGMPVFLPTRKK